MLQCSLFSAFVITNFIIQREIKNELKREAPVYCFRGGKGVSTGMKMKTNEKLFRLYRWLAVGWHVEICAASSSSRNHRQYIQLDYKFAFIQSIIALQRVCVGLPTIAPVRRKGFATFSSLQFTAIYYLRTRQKNQNIFLFIFSHSSYAMIYCYYTLLLTT